MKFDRCGVAFWLCHPPRLPIPISAGHNPPQSHQFSIHRFPTTRTAPPPWRTKESLNKWELWTPLSPVWHRRWSSLDKRNDYWQAKLIKIHFNLQGIFRSRHLSQTRWELILWRRGRVTTGQGWQMWKFMFWEHFEALWVTITKLRAINSEKVKSKHYFVKVNTFLAKLKSFLAKTKTFRISNPANNLLSRFSHRILLDV